MTGTAPTDWAKRYPGGFLTFFHEIPTTHSPVIIYYSPLAQENLSARSLNKVPKAIQFMSDKPEVKIRDILREYFPKFVILHTAGLEGFLSCCDY